MSYETEVDLVDLTKLGSGIHNSVLDLDHTEMPHTTGETDISHKLGNDLPTNTIIMKYTQKRTEQKPIINTQEDGYSERLRSRNTYDSSDYR